MPVEDRDRCYNYTKGCAGRRVSHNLCWDCAEKGYSASEKGDYKIEFPEGKEVFYLTYEEMVEIFANYRDRAKVERLGLSGNEYFVSAVQKAGKIFSALPVTNY